MRQKNGTVTAYMVGALFASLYEAPKLESFILYASGVHVSSPFYEENDKHVHDALAMAMRKTLHTTFQSRWPLRRLWLPLLHRPHLTKYHPRLCNALQEFTMSRPLEELRLDTTPSHVQSMERRVQNHRNARFVILCVPCSGHVSRAGSDRVARIPGGRATKNTILGVAHSGIDHWSRRNHYIAAVHETTVWSGCVWRWT